MRASEVIGAKRNSEEKAPEKRSKKKKRRFPVALSWYSTLESSVCELDANARRRRRARWPVPPLPPSPPRVRRRATRPASARNRGLWPPTRFPRRRRPRLARRLRDSLLGFSSRPSRTRRTPNTRCLSCWTTWRARETSCTCSWSCPRPTPRARWRTEARWYRASPNRRGRARSRRSLVSPFFFRFFSCFFAAEPSERSF